MKCRIIGTMTSMKRTTKYNSRRQGSTAASFRHRKTSREKLETLIERDQSLPREKETKIVAKHADTVLSGLEVLWRQGLLCDVMLHVDGFSFPAHKIVLATSCDFFHGYFTAHPNCEDVDLDSAGLSQESVEVLLECIYTGKVQICEKSVRDILAVATALKFHSIENACGEFLSDRLSKFNCLRMLAMADTYKLSDLRERSLTIAAKHFQEVSSGFDFYQLELDQIILLIGRDDIKAESELDVFERVMSWLEYDKRNRLNLAFALLQQVRLPLLSPSDIVDHVETVSYLMANQECQNLVKEALRYHCLPARQSIMQSIRTSPRSSEKFESLLAIGGAPRLLTEQVNNDVHYYNPRTDQWRLLTKMKRPRHHHAVASLGGFLYIAGGEETNDQQSPINTAYRFDPRTMTWLQIASMLRCRESFQLGVLGDMLYAVGGRVNHEESLADVERYNPACDEWQPVAPLSDPRRSVAVAAHNGRLYAMGGSGKRKISHRVERYNPLTNQWEHRRPLNVPRFFGSLAPIGNRLYLFGGATLDSTGAVSCVETVESYTPMTDTWSTLAPMLTPRAEAGYGVLSNKIYVVGGYSWNSNLRLASVEVFDIDKNKWFSVAPIDRPLTGIGCCGITLYHEPKQLPVTSDDTVKEQKPESLGFPNDGPDSDNDSNASCLAQCKEEDFDDSRIKHSKSEDNITIKSAKSFGQAIENSLTSQTECNEAFLSDVEHICSQDRIDP